MGVRLAVPDLGNLAAVVPQFVVFRPGRTNADGPVDANGFGELRDGFLVGTSGFFPIDDRPGHHCRTAAVPPVSLVVGCRLFDHRFFLRSTSTATLGLSVFDLRDDFRIHGSRDRKTMADSVAGQYLHLQFSGKIR